MNWNDVLSAVQQEQMQQLAYSEPAIWLMNLNAVRIYMDILHQQQTIGVWFSFIVHSCYNGRFMFPTSFSLQTLGTLVYFI